MKPKIIKNFLHNREVKSLNEWTLDNYQNPLFIDPKMNHDEFQTRYTTRHVYLREKKYQNIKLRYPKEVYDIQNRILKTFNLNKNNIAPPPSFYDGVCTTISFSPGGCVEHIDPIYYPNTYTLHCNFITQYPKHGGITVIDEIEYKTNPQDLLMYVTSHSPHSCIPGEGDIPRILWVYGMAINKTKLNKILNNLAYE